MIGQVTLHSEPPLNLQQANPPLNAPLNPNNLPANYNVGYNTGFTVKVKQTGTTVWKDLYEYNTFVNSNLGSGLSTSSASSFVTFDLAGSADIEITCNQYTGQTLSTSDVTIRPLSKNISPTVTGNKIQFTITGPSKYSVELKGNRHTGLHIFANTPYVPQTTSYTLTYEAGINYYNFANNSVSKKIRVKPGAVLIVPFDTNNRGRILLKSGDEIFIEKGGIVKGAIRGVDAQNVKVYGGGIIDITNYRKQFNEDVADYEYITSLTFYNCTNIVLDGVILNDSQEVCVGLFKCDTASINNIKAFSRARWGDGIHLEGTSNVTINDCFLRNSDDCVAIYAERHTIPATPETYTYKEAGNISCTNTLLYCDKARPIEIGWHGDWNTDHKLNIYNILFQYIDILEHDNLGDTGIGAISINCGDNNICSELLFRNINIEDFSNGRLFSVRTEYYDDAVDKGKEVTHVRFENITYNGYNELPSSIKGIDCEHFVNGVHFYNLKINGNVITKADDYIVNDTPMFDVNQYAYNITFQEPDNYSTQLSNGKFRIRKKGTSLYLTVTNGTITLQPYSTNASSMWQVEKLADRPHYYIKNSANGLYLECDLSNYPPAFCQARFLFLNQFLQDKYSQEWKIVPSTSGAYRINNGYNYSYITHPFTTSGLNSVYSMPIGSGSNEWEFISTGTQRLKRTATENNDTSVVLYPNPASDKLTINSPEEKTGELKITCYDSAGREVINCIIKNNTEIDITKLESGVYTITITGDNTYRETKFIKI